MVAPPPAQAKPAPVGKVEVANADPTRALFIASCAQCHGEKGDGEGVTQLDRKARSFLAGGFSYGNTKDAILRSITHGIPGTPMPAFEKALTVEQRTALADYVITLGPERLVVDPSESEMVVKDKPLVVRGRLPALAEGGPEIPRGLAIGTPDGLTYEYRADDVQLVRVRAGRFVNRTDWSDRGGTALEMLGTPIWSTPIFPRSVTGLALRRNQDGWAVGDEPTVGALIATEVTNGVAMLEYVLSVRGESNASGVLVRETMAPVRTDIGSGFVLRRSVSAREGGLFLADTQPSVAGVERQFSVPKIFTLLPGERPTLIATRFSRADGRGGLPTARNEMPAIRAQNSDMISELSPGSDITVTTMVIPNLPPGTKLNSELVSKIARELGE